MSCRLLNSSAAAAVIPFSWWPSPAVRPCRHPPHVQTIIHTPLPSRAVLRRPPPPPQPPQAPASPAGGGFARAPRPPASAPPPAWAGAPAPLAGDMAARRGGGSQAARARRASAAGGGRRGSQLSDSCAPGLRRRKTRARASRRGSRPPRTGACGGWAGRRGAASPPRGNGPRPCGARWSGGPEGTAVGGGRRVGMDRALGGDRQGVVPGECAEFPKELGGRTRASLM